MKYYLRNIFTILVSGVLILCTMLSASFGNYERGTLSVKQENEAKVSSQENIHELSVKNINVEKMFDKFSPQGQKQNIGTKTTSASSSVGETSTTVSEASESTSSVTATTTAVVPADESKNIEYIQEPNYESPYYIVVYTGGQSAVVYGKDESGAYNVKIKAFTVSTGRSSSPTRKGVYKIRAKYRWRKLMGDCYGQYSSSISPDYLFHSVPYARRSPDSLYNASYNNLGKAVSHGCIRMCVRDCKWIYDNCPIGTQVNVVWASGPKGAGVPQRKSASRYSGWDPSDQWSANNPYFHNVSTTESKPVTTVKTTTTKKKTTTDTSSSKETSVTSASSTTSVPTSSEPQTTTSTTTTTATTTTTTTTTTTAATTTTTDPKIDDFPVVYSKILHGFAA